MRRPTSVAILAAAVAAAIVTCCGAAWTTSVSSQTHGGESHQPICNRLVLGVHADLVYEGSSATRQTVIRALQNTLRAQIVRSTLPWHLIEPQQGRADWSRADAAITEMVAVGIRPLVVLAGSPSWANGVASNITGHQFYVPVENDDFNQWLDAFANFAHAAALRYGKKVNRWEIWNEPNIAAFWRPQPNPKKYAEVYRRVRAAIIAADPTARIATGGVTVLRTAWQSGNIKGLEFLNDVVDAGVRPSLVAIHPYTTPPHAPDRDFPGENNFDDIGLVHSLLLARGLHASIWVTEWGWSSRRIGLARQAAYVERSLEILSKYAYVTVATYFIDHDRPPRFFEGLLDSSLTLKPAGRRLAAFARSLEHCSTKRQKG